MVSSTKEEEKTLSFFLGYKEHPVVQGVFLTSIKVKAFTSISRAAFITSDNSSFQ
jgi:hypothetical protein